MTPTQILALINQYIVSNGQGLITGPILNQILTAIVNLFTTSAAAAARIVSASTTLTVLSTDQYIGFQRSFGVVAMVANLPVFSIGQAVTLTDLSGNFNASPVTVTPPVGHSIVGRATYVMNEDFQSATFRYYGANSWGLA